MNARSISRNALIFAAILLAQIAAAQTLPSAPAKTPSSQPSAGAYDWFAQAGWVCGVGASTSSIDTKPTAQCGGILSGPFFDFEAGAMGPLANGSAASGYLSTNLWIPLIPWQHLANPHGVPFAVGGYTHLFGTGNALDYGLAFAHPIDASHSIQFEVRDYWTFSDPHEHNIVFRVVWLTGLSD